MSKGCKKGRCELEYLQTHKREAKRSLGELHINRFKCRICGKKATITKRVLPGE